MQRHENRKCLNKKQASLQKLSSVRTWCVEISSVSKVTGYEPDDRGSACGRDKNLSQHKCY